MPTDISLLISIDILRWWGSVIPLLFAAWSMKRWLLD